MRLTRLFFFLLIGLISTVIGSYAQTDTYRLLVKNSTVTKQLKSTTRVLVRTQMVAVRGFANAVSLDSIYVYQRLVDTIPIARIAIRDITSVKRKYTSFRAGAVGLFFGGALLAVSNFQKIGSSSSGFKDAMVGTGIGFMFFSAVSFPISFAVEHASQRSIAGGWKFESEIVPKGIIPPGNPKF